ncbi:MAG: hypothetical protein EA341_06115 [Mongoliibacter sp.]|jgi:F0F1-type ATP synthase membrane subunit b/b'|uniref:hypothetical protein n=1 Tax=Mongoliibacter sp. TaxID=2022438 RepID=UPI0012F2BC5F|nr:hypothetical protein [Mongoliibacter sp.]TVP50947.1 MAG: hypothetical protein EA341_06115 [Mongoliibacter sp.]
MSDKNTGFDEIESLFQEIGTKIEELIEKGKEASGEAKVDIEQKIKDLRSKKTTLEKEFNKGKARAEKLYQEKKEEYEPTFNESMGHFKEGVKQILEGIKILLGSK